MSEPFVGALLAAAALGATHAIEPDHVAGIASLTSRYGDPRLSAVVGACFSLGHVALVVAWLAVGYVLLGRTEFPAVYDRIGAVGVAVLLGALGAGLAVGGLRRVFYAHSHEHEHDGEVHSHVHAHVTLFGGDEHRHAPDDHAGEDESDQRIVTHHDGIHHDGIHHDDRHNDDAQDEVHHATATHDHTVGAYLKTGVVGALFTLSPPSR